MRSRLSWSLFRAASSPCSICIMKQKTAYEMRISDWSSDVCSSDLLLGGDERKAVGHGKAHLIAEHRARAHARAVVLLDAVLEDVADKVEILLHSIGSSMVGVQVESAQTMPSSGVSTSPRDTTTAAARSPVTFSVVRHMSRKRSTPSTRDRKSVV